MTEPAIYFTTAKLCGHCGKPRWIEADLARWRRECGSLKDRRGGSIQDPAWSRKICWGSSGCCYNLAHRDEP